MPQVFITGGAGFIGSNLAKHLLEHNYAVSIADNLSSGKLQNISDLFYYPQFSFLQTDVSEMENIREFVENADIIIHLAAKVGVMQSISNPIGTITNNFNSTESILKLSLLYDKRLIISSSSEVYGKYCNTDFHESDEIHIGSPVSSRWAYSSVKATEEFMAMAYASIGLNVTICRFFNIIGLNQSSNYGMVVPRFITQAINNQPITIYGTGDQMRSFCDVRDLARAIRLIIEKPEITCKIVNIGNTFEITIHELAKKIKILTASDSEIINIGLDELPAGYDDVFRRKPNLTLIKELYSWYPLFELDETLNYIIRQNAKKKYA